MCDLLVDTRHERVKITSEREILGIISQTEHKFSHHSIKPDCQNRVRVAVVAYFRAFLRKQSKKGFKTKKNNFNFNSNFNFT